MRQRTESSSRSRCDAISSIRAAWLARAARLGETITARIGSGEITGRFDTIDETGHLILTTSQGRQAIAAADVFF